MYNVFVSGMPYEDKIAKKLSDKTVWGDTDTILDYLHSQNDIRSIVSFGVCGALSNTFKPGDVAIGKSVLCPDGAIYFPDTNIIGGWQAAVCGSDEILATPEEKDEFWFEGCDVVDMQSHVVARFASERDIPFYIIRAVVDPYDFDLPPVALIPPKEDGSLDIWAITKSLARKPWQFPAVIRTWWWNRKAIRALQRVQLNKA
jgi:adenosylhomocysteine nucleosidase